MEQVEAHRVLPLGLKSPALAVLLDPEKKIEFHAGELNKADLILVGGSTGSLSPAFIDELRTLTHRPIVLFPGNPSQFVPNADAIFFLSVLSSRNPDMLLTPHIAAAETIYRSGMQVLPMGYILIDGGCSTSVQQASHSTPIPQSDIQQIVSTALAGEMLGKRLIYLEAGSGAKNPVSTDIIRAVRAVISVPLIVGGGITTPTAMHAAIEAGADIVVIGNHLEHHPEQLPLFAL